MHWAVRGGDALARLEAVFGGLLAGVASSPVVSGTVELLPHVLRIPHWH
jgi:hypothetical protein